MYIPTGNAIYNWLCMLYCGTILMVKLVDLVRLCFVYVGDTFGTVLMLKVVSHTWTLQSALGTVMLQLLSPKREQGLDVWGKCKQKAPPNSNLQLMHKRAITTSIISCLTVVLFVGEYMYSILMYGPPLTDLHVLLFFKPGYVPVWARLSFTILYCEVFVAWFPPQAYLVNITLALRDDFLILNQEMRKAVTSLTPVDIEYFRHRHVDLCTLTQQLDKSFSFYVLLIYVTNIPIICGCIYIFTFGEYIREYYTYTIVKTIVCCFLHIMIITLVGTLLNLEVSMCVSLNEAK